MADVAGANAPHFRAASSSSGTGARADDTVDTPLGDSAAPGTTHFGFQTVEAGRKQQLVEDVFRRVADNYDVMNDLMSASLHRLWKDAFVRMCAPVHNASPSSGSTVLDVAGGTGDIAFRIVDAIRASPVLPGARPHVIVCDINASMLGVGEERAHKLGYMKPDGDVQLSWMQGNAETLEAIPSGSVDLYTIAFGIRNVTNINAALATAYRVLKPGGRFMCLEFSTVTNPLLRAVYDLYSFNVIPAIGQVVANDRAAYQYLVESIRRFPQQDAFADMMRDAGFSYVTYTNFTSGVCAVHSGFKWPSPPADGAVPR